jgi:alpha-ketoglutarate-dependent taurine dioxygenase
VSTKAIVFGESRETLPAAEMKKLIKKTDQLSVAFEWEQGDILVIDNRLAMHSRKPFVKPRVVLASLAR